jgi:2-oxoglutarate ferredoxin oxidoreductase subunit gamma
MSQTEIVIAGFGGQGVLFAGQILAYAAMDSGRHVTWIPSYGPEMRGGTANCTVIVADEEIGSPLVRNPQAAAVLNLPSLDKYESLVRPGGVLVYNTSMTDREVRRQDLVALPVPATEIAESLGDKRLANMVLLGALVSRLPVLAFGTLEEALARHLSARHRHLLQANIRALKEGAAVSEREPEAIGS